MDDRSKEHQERGSSSPAPKWLAHTARLLMLAILALVGHWVYSFLGGLSLSPRDDGKGGNDTGQLFNWHPVLMTLAFAVCMSEAVLTYQAPLLPWLTRPDRKRIHYTLHSLAAICITLGLLAAFRSHTLKLPSPTPNLYSPHSWLGVATVALAASQYILGFVAYLYPQLSLSFRVWLGPIHRFTGIATWTMGLATMAVGFQEKVTFIQMGKALSGAGLYSGILAVPAAILVLLGLLAMAVLFHQVPAPGASSPESREPAASREPLLMGQA